MRVQRQGRCCFAWKGEDEGSEIGDQRFVARRFGMGYGRICQSAHLVGEPDSGVRYDSVCYNLLNLAKGSLTGSEHRPGGTFQSPEFRRVPGKVVPWFNGTRPSGALRQ